MINPNDNIEQLFDVNYTDPEFKVILETHLIRLMKLAEENIIPVTAAEAYKYDYDYYNLLRYKNIDYRIHWITMRVNGRIDPNASCEDVREIKVPPMEEIKRLLDYYKNQKNQEK